MRRNHILAGLLLVVIVAAVLWAPHFGILNHDDASARIGSESEKPTEGNGSLQENPAATEPVIAQDTQTKPAMATDPLEFDATQQLQELGISEEPEETQPIVDSLEKFLRTQDLALAYPAYLAISNCRFLRESEQNWEASKNRMARMLEDNELDPGEMLLIELEMIDPDIRRNDCMTLQSLRNESLGEELLHSARTGDPFARFIYAIWNPRNTDHTGLDFQESIGLGENSA